ncbi:MAG TPA: sulfur transferase domain-containing protein [Gemmatimonadales bacterium]|nr:sulfur transferase domain-containing protein [Gemmatimonadales bacterium]
MTADNPLLVAFHDTPRATPLLPWLISGGQPSERDLVAAQAAGLVAVIDIRDPMEPRPFEEPEAIAALGVAYVNLPVVSGDLSDRLMDEILAALRQHAGTPTLLHCASANRVGGPTIAYLMLDHHVPEADAVDIAMRAGLRSAELMEWAIDYAKRHET